MSLSGLKKNLVICKSDCFMKLQFSVGWTLFSTFFRLTILSSHLVSIIFFWILRKIEYVCMPSMYFIALIF